MVKIKNVYLFTKFLNLLIKIVILSLSSISPSCAGTIIEARAICSRTQCDWPGAHDNADNFDLEGDNRKQVMDIFMTSVITLDHFFGKMTVRSINTTLSISDGRHFQYIIYLILNIT